MAVSGTKDENFGCDSGDPDHFSACLSARRPILVIPFPAIAHFLFFATRIIRFKQK